MLIDLEFGAGLNFLVLGTPANSYILDVLASLDLLVFKFVVASAEEFKFKHFDLMTTLSVVTLEVYCYCFAWVHDVRTQRVVCSRVASLKSEVASNLQIVSELGSFEVVSLGWAVNLNFNFAY